MRIVTMEQRLYSGLCDNGFNEYDLSIYTQHESPVSTPSSFTSSKYMEKLEDMPSTQAAIDYVQYNMETFDRDIK